MSRAGFEPATPCLKVLTKLKPDKGFSELHLAESRKVAQKIRTSAPQAHPNHVTRSAPKRREVHPKLLRLTDWWTIIDLHVSTRGGARWVVRRRADQGWCADSIQQL